MFWPERGGQPNEMTLFGKRRTQAQAGLLTGVGVGDFVHLVGVQPHLLLAASHNGGGKPLVQLEGTVQGRERETIIIRLGFP